MQKLCIFMYTFRIKLNILIRIRHQLPLMCGLPVVLTTALLGHPVVIVFRAIRAGVVNRTIRVDSYES